MNSNLLIVYFSQSNHTRQLAPGDPAANRRRTRGAAAGSPLSRILSRRGAAGTGGASHRQPPSPAPIGEPAGPLRHPSCRNSQLVWYHRPASADLPERQRSVRQKGSAVLYQWRRRIRYYPPGSGADVPCFHLPARLTGVRQRRLGGATVPLAPSNRRSLNRLGDTACASPLTDWSGVCHNDKKLCRGACEQAERKSSNFDP